MTHFGKHELDRAMHDCTAKGLEGEAIPACYVLANQGYGIYVIPVYNAVKTPPVKEPAKAQEGRREEDRHLWFLSLELICNSHFNWSAPFIVVPKGDGEKCLVIDYRALNKVTWKLIWPMSRVEDIF